MRDLYDGFTLGDARLDQRFARLRASAEFRPDASFPVLAGSEAAREATYRFFNNKRVTLGGMLAPHFRSSVERLRTHPVVLVLHDSSEFKFGGEARRPGLGRMPSGQGFLGHFALGVAANGTREPLGILGVTTIFRDGPLRRANQTRRWAPDRESLRWRDLMLEVEDRAKHPALVHVMDREADSYELLHLMAQRSLRFVIRLNKQRLARGVDDDVWIPTDEQLASTRMTLEREVTISRRSANRPEGPRRTHPPREGRAVTLSIGAQRIVLRRPGKAPAGLPPTLTVNVVRVWEANPPPGEQPIEWTLLTSESIDSKDDLERVVDWYRARWVIEEFFKALKTGCRYEERQLENRPALLNALALFIPIACSLLALRTEARCAERSAEPSTVVTKTQLAVLRHLLPKLLTKEVTARTVYLAIAEVGGHVSSNGEPGWLVLTRGYTKLIEYERIWALAIEAQKCDQT